MPALPETTDSFDATHEWNRDGRPPSIAVVEAIAAMDGIDPTELDVVLYDYLDPDALDRLFRSQTGGDLEVEFRVRDLLVTIRADGSLGIRTIDDQDRTIDSQGDHAPSAMPMASDPQ